MASSRVQYKHTSPSGAEYIGFVSYQHELQEYDEIASSAKQSLQWSYRSGTIDILSIDGRRASEVETPALEVEEVTNSVGLVASLPLDDEIVELITANGITTVDQLRAVGDLTKLKGIGKVYAEKIEAALA